MQKPSKTIQLLRVIVVRDKDWDHLHHNGTHDVSGCLGHTRPSCLIPVVLLLEIDGKCDEFDPITGVVAQRAQHDQEAREPDIAWNATFGLSFFCAAITVLHLHTSLCLVSSGPTMYGVKALLVEKW